MIIMKHRTQNFPTLRPGSRLHVGTQPRTLDGFTLIEILVVVLVMSIIATVAGDVLISVLRSANKANILNEVNQNGNFVLSTIESTARNAKCAYTNSANLVIIDQYNQINEFRFGVENGAGVVQKATSGGSFYSLTNSNSTSGVEVDTATSVFSVFPTLSFCDQSKTPLITITVRLKQGLGAPGRVDYQADSIFKKSIELRNY